MPAHSEHIAKYELLVSRLTELDEEQQVAAREALLQQRIQFQTLKYDYGCLPPPPSKPWTIPRIFSHGRPENFISDYLAHLLRPDINGLGAAPLVALAEATQVDLELVSSDLTEVNIYREYYLDGGRIDLLIEWPGQLVIAIEVKLGASENPGQTTGYASVLKREFKGTPLHCFLLTRTGERAKSPIFRSLQWSQVLAAFQTVPIPPECTQRQRTLWEDFLEHLEVDIIMADPDHFEFSERAMLYFEHRELINELQRAFESDWGDAITFLENHLYANISGGPWELNFNRYKHDWHKIYKRAWQSAGLDLHFEFWLPPASLFAGKVEYWLDIENVNAKAFLEHFDQYYPALEEQYRQRGIEYRPPRRRHAIAAKIFRTDASIEAVADTMVEAFAEFRFLEEVLEQALATFSP